MTDWGGLGGIWDGRELEGWNPFETTVNELFGDEIRKSDGAATAMWGALANVIWEHENGDRASYSFRAAGDLVAAVRGSGMYMDWYCSGPHGVVSPEISTAMKGKGWTWRLYD